jgi:hypothetical protein
MGKRMTRTLSTPFLLIALIVAVAGCSGAGSSASTNGTSPTAIPTLSMADILLGRGHSQLPSLLDGATAPPVAFKWTDVEATKPLIGPQAAAFCRALDLPRADDALTSLLFLGLNALSERLAHRPFPEDGEKVLGLAVTFAVKTCPTWIPKTTPLATPKADWFPEHYGAVVGNPDVAWAYRLATEIKCGAREAHCTDILVIARDGCPFMLSVSVVFKDRTGLVVDNVTESRLSVPAMKVQTVHLATIRSSGELVQGSLFLCS